MTISFVALTTYQVSGTGAGGVRGGGRGAFAGNSGRGRVRLSGKGEQGNHGAGRVVLSGRGSQYGNHGRGHVRLRGKGYTGITPPKPNHGHGAVALTGAGTGYSGEYGTGAAIQRFSGRGADVANFGRGRVRLTGHGSDAALLVDGVIALFQSPGTLLMTSGYAKQRVSDTLAIAATPVQQVVNTIIERLQLIAQPTTALQAVMLLRDAVEFVDQLGVIWKLLLQDTVAVTGVPTPSLVAIEQVVEILALIAGPGSALSIQNLVAETLALNDTLAVVAKESIGETAAFAEAFSTALQARNQLLDELLLAAVPSGSARILAVIDESIDFGATPGTALEALNRIQETIGFSLTLTIGDDTYIAWVVNTETRAAWQYENWPFNSYCEFEGTYYGAMDDGVYTLAGDDDAGDDIKARFRIGMSNMGIAREKRFPALYLSYAASGKLVLKAITTEIDGTRSEYWYQLTPRGTGGVREGRVQIGRGLKAFLWDWEIANVDGADFEIDSLQFMPLVLDRKVRGRDG